LPLQYLRQTHQSGLVEGMAAVLKDARRTKYHVLG